ncbi:MAG TPA: FMN-binding protein [Micromonosporaceae bacterium]|nr:FMN-binding protein [Micromonosporaceae bacterium]
MRRAILAVCGTAVGTALLVGAKSAGTLADHGVAVGPAPGTAKPGPVGSAAASASARPVPGAGPGPAASARPAGAATAVAPVAGRYRDGTYAGSSTTYKYGTIKVTITVSGGRITQATATHPTHGQSGVINGKAVPKLNAETLQAQDADIATVSGATLTSEAYRTSLQAALDRAGG